MAESAQFTKSLPPALERFAPYLTLKRVGRKWLALCPYHQERTPSFTIDLAQNSFHCFGCHASGPLDAAFEQLQFQHGDRSCASSNNEF